MASVNQILMIFTAAFALILLLFILRSLWTIVTMKYQNYITNKRLDPFSTPATVSATTNVTRSQQIPSISSQLQSSQIQAQVTRNNRMSTANTNRQTFPRSNVSSQSRNHPNNRLRPSRLEVLPQRHQPQTRQCQCTSHRNNHLNSGVRNQANSLANDLSLKIVLDDPPTYHEATKLPTFEESQKYAKEQKNFQN